MSTTRELDHAVAALHAGELVIMPTETVYGLAANARDPSAVARLYAAKGRPRFNPLIVHVANRAMAEAIGRFDDRARTLATRFWPGPLTLVVPSNLAPDARPACDLARAGLTSVALRCPAHPVALALLQAFGGGVVAPSANLSGRPSPTTYADAVEETGAAAAVALDGGDCAVGLESSVVSVPDGPLRLLRPGGLRRAMIEAVVGPLTIDAADADRSPGRLALHYAPNAPVRLFAAEPHGGEAYLAFGDARPGPLVWNLSPSADLAEAAKNLFAYLRAADRTHPRAIAVAPIPEVDLGEAINDRLRRAAGFVG